MIFKEDFKEIVKELKEVGFPNADKRCSYCVANDNDECSECEDRTIGLSELIEACGDKFYQLRHLVHEENIKWVAHATEMDTTLNVFFGKTPEIAVSKLYLELNKK